MAGLASTIAPFLWQGNTGATITKAELDRRKKIADALRPGGDFRPTGPWSLAGGLASEGAATYQEAQAAEAQSAAEKSVADALANGDYKGVIANDLATPQQSAVAQALWQQQMQDEDPMRKLQLEQAQLDLEQDRNPPAIQEPEREAPSSVQEWEYYSGLTPEQQGQYIRMKRANPYLDIGTGFVQPDPINPGQTSGPAIVKDNFTPAYDSASGTATGKVDVENKAAADSLESKMPGLKTVIGELGELAKTATYTQTGQLWDSIVRETGQMPSEGAIARTNYIAMVDNQVLPLLRDTFGAAFTVKEGETLRATLGDPNKSPLEKEAILEAFIEQKVRDLEALQSRIPAGSGGAPNYKDKYGLE